MKKVSKLYLFFTSLFFLFSPFSLGLVAIYFEDSNLEDEFSGLIMNVGLVIILGIVMGSMIAKEKLEKPNINEIKLLIFGALSNIVIYFYVFQNALNIDDFVTIYFAMILILFLYLIIIDHVNLNYELWIFAILFFTVDLIFFTYIGTQGDTYFHNDVPANFIQRLFFITVPLTTLILFISKIRKYDVIDTFTKIFIVITILVGLVFFEGIDVEDKFILTLNLIVPFIIIIDFILSIIYKRFDPYKLTFYLRMGTFILLIYIYDGISYFVMSSYSDHNLAELVMITYVVIVCNLIEYLIPNKKIN